MNSTSRFMAGLLLLALVSQDAAAQWNVARYDRSPNRVYATFGVDPAMVTSLGYGRVVSVLGHRFQLAADASIGTTGLDLHDFRARVQAGTALLRWRSLALTGSATFVARGTENSIYRGFNFGSDFTGTAGVYRPGWHVAGEFGFDKAVISHITHSDWYRQFYPEARDGWYLDAGGTFHYGVTTGVAVGAVEVFGRAGWRRTDDFDTVMPPIYVTVGAGLGF